MEKTIREAYLEASSFLASAESRSTQNPERVTEWMLCSLLGWDRSKLFLDWQEPLPKEKQAQWEGWLRRKAAGEPVQYIIGEQEFYGRPFQVNPHVLIPRPETELLVEAALAWGRAWRPGLVADIGTGSGIIPITLALEEPAWELSASDLSADALTVARENAARHGVSGRISFYEGDLLEPWLERHLVPDLLISNPPYVPLADEQQMSPEVAEHEPPTALYGGHDGLELYRRLAEQLKLLPRLPDWIGLEVGEGQAGEVADMLQGLAESAGEIKRSVRVIQDLAGIDRHVILQTAT
ncbi:peptide chain release factor N(5)-glutamine methyltransferase [Xylanibacillus composti]|uniref:Release factor glutamine methyltransferase n=1 Tax=Xylanibacillus composti TaxID=1572762 RepID=A0A8J4M469_9BACL|nr:peptide chain release factor N(5)-glutamine methyltransferase [Xylanibacillus composti]MDT9726008.1 peptide chain release factor N(5)-glutamine methyltransferase [Xylanibacillus composti]GIQ70837.1 release factor glutamine methyltransferase [Xylanibacillus composti]